MNAGKPGSRREVNRAVRNGCAVNDPTLARDAVNRSIRVQRQVIRLGTWLPWIFVGGLLFGLVEVARGNMVGASIFLLPLLTWPLIPRRAREMFQSAAQSEAANQRLMDEA